MGDYLLHFQDSEEWATDREIDFLNLVSPDLICIIRFPLYLMDKCISNKKTYLSLMSLAVEEPAGFD